MATISISSLGMFNFMFGPKLISLRESLSFSRPPLPTSKIHTDIVLSAFDCLLEKK